MLIRQNAPVLGVSTNLYQQPGELQLSLSMRALRSDTHYRLDKEQVERHERGTYVVNRQQAVDLTATYAFTRRFAVSAGIPVTSASWSIPSPTAPTPGPRAQQDARGLGDISVAGRFWIGSERCVNGNVAIGFGVKMPTGDYDARGRVPDRNGQNNELRFVDQSVQPGDGSYGTVWAAVPIAFYQNRKPDPYTGLQGDATFPKFIFLAGYQMRIGGPRPQVRTSDTP